MIDILEKNLNKFFIMHNANFMFAYAQFCPRENLKLHPTKLSHVGIHETHICTYLKHGLVSLAHCVHYSTR